MTVPALQQPLLQCTTLEVQEPSTGKCIHQLRMPAAASALGEEATIVLQEWRKVHTGK